MGQSLGLTTPNSAVMDPSGNPTFIGTPQQAQNKLWQPGLTSPPVAPGTPPPATSQTSLGTPSFLQAAAQGESAPGAGNALSPGLSKAGKLAVLLTGGLKGALAGQAASEQMTAQSGGRRSGGAGIGFEAGLASPFTQAAPQQEFQQRQAQTSLLQAQSQMVPTPYGMMPAGIARFILPAQLREAGQIGAANINAGSRQNVAQTQAASAANVAGINKRFIPVNGVGLFDTQSRQVIPETNQGITITPEIAADEGLPEQFIGKPMRLTDLSSLMRGQDFQNTPVTGANGPALVNRKTGVTMPLGLGSPAMAGVVPTVDPNNPGNVVYTPKTQAVNQKLPSPESGAAEGARDIQGKNAADAYQTLQQSQTRLNIMQENLKDALTKGDQQAMLSLLANHLGMTMGVQKGARLNQALINEAQQSQPWLQGMKAKFDSRGYLSGVTLSPAQMQSMVTLAKNRLAQDQRLYQSMRGYNPTGAAPSGGTGGPTPFSQWQQTQPR